MRIGAHELSIGSLVPLLVAPMAGITDRPFRRLARRYGAALAVSEMVSARPELRTSRKTRLRLDHAGEPSPVSVQIAGADPAMLAEAARLNVAEGAEIIDINMGCPAKRVIGKRLRVPRAPQPATIEPMKEGTATPTSWSVNCDAEL